MAVCKKEKFCFFPCQLLLTAAPTAPPPLQLQALSLGTFL